MPSAVNSRPMARSTVRTKTLVTLAMLTAVAFVVSYLSKAMPSVMGFLDFDFKDVAICIGGFTFGPVAAAGVTLATSILQMFTVSTTGIIGCIMNILATAGFCCTASFIYKKKHTMLGAILGLSAGVVVLTAAMLLWNYLITPLYMTGTSRADVAAMLVPVFLPFNLVKGGMNMAATLLLYKPVVTALRRAGLVPPSQSGETARRSSAGYVMLSLALFATFLLLMLVMMGLI